MDIRKKNGLPRLIWFFLFGGVYISALSFMVTSATLIKAPAGLIIALGFGAALLAGVVFYNKTTFLVSLGAGAGLILIRLFLLCDGTERARLLSGAAARLRDIGGQIMGAPYRAEDGVLLITLLSCVFALLAACAFYKRILFWAAAVPPLVCYLIGALGRYEVNVVAALVLFLWLLVLFLLSRREKAARETGGGRVPLTGARGMLRGTLPLCALLAAASLLLAGVVPLVSGSSPGMRTAAPQFSDLGDFLDSMQLHGQWFNITGFSSGDTKLGGDLYLDDSRVMDVRADQRTYLVGTTYRVYNGSAWLEDAGGKTLCDPYDLDGDYAETLYREEVYDRQRITVTMRQSGDVLFYPDRPASFRLSRSGSTVLTDQNSGYYIQPTLTPGDSYAVDARRLDLSSEQTAEAITVAGEGFYEAQGDDRMAVHADALRQAYTQLPASLPERVTRLAEEIAGREDTDYQKAKAIEQYLCANFTYTLQPGNLPPNQDFVDYFLFANPEGYCTHFATTMTVLCRSVGLPARYVKGFVTPAAPNDQGVYEVTGRMAHAWTEVYLEGMGWIRFEPTSVFNSEWSSRYEVLGEDVIQEVEYLEETGFYYEESDDGQTVSSRPENTLSQPSSNLPASSSASSAPPETSSAPSSSSSSAITFSSDLSSLTAPATASEPAPVGSGASLTAGLLAGLALLVLIAVILILRVHRVKKRLRARLSATGGERMERTFRELLRLAAYLGGEPRTGETATAFALRLAEQPATASLRLEEAAALYEKALFGPGEPGEEDIRRLDEIYDTAFAGIRSGLSTIRYLRLRYLQNRL